MRYLLASAVLCVMACGGTTDGGITNPPPGGKKPDPFVVIRMRDMMDTTTAPGRAHWHTYLLLTGPYANQNGIAYQGNIGLNDVELGHSVRCVKVAADSVGQRLLAIVAFADTTTPELTPDEPAKQMADRWYAGDHTLPAGWMVLTFPPTDAFDGQQYQNGHGLTRDDPIKWSFDWTASGAVSFYERADADPLCTTF